MKLKRIKKIAKEWKWPLILGAICLIALIAMALILANPKVKELPFEKPPFAEAAAQGEPKVPENLGWQLLHQEGMDFKVGLCGVLKFDGNMADLYFTNPAENEIRMKLRITDAKGKILAETGLIRPGEYLETIEFSKVPANGEQVQMKVMTYESDYTSAGAITLKTTVQK